MDKKSKVNSKNNINKMLKSVLERLEKTETFVLDQAPEVCREIVEVNFLDKFIKGLAILVIGLVLSIVIVSLALYLVKTDEAAYGLLMFLIFPMLTFYISSVLLLDAYIIKKSPKLTIIKEIKKLID